MSSMSGLGGCGRRRRRVRTARRDRGGGEGDGDLGGDGEAGIAEVEGGERAPEGRIRRPGAGRPSIEERESGLPEALLALLEGATRATRNRRFCVLAAASPT
jgi:hypothetical protein